MGGGGGNVLMYWITSRREWLPESAAEQTRVGDKHAGKNLSSSLSRLSRNGLRRWQPDGRALRRPNRCHGERIIATPWMRDSMTRMDHERATQRAAGCRAGHRAKAKGLRPRCGNALREAGAYQRLGLRLIQFVKATVRFWSGIDQTGEYHKSFMDDMQRGNRSRRKKKAK